MSAALSLSPMGGASDGGRTDGTDWHRYPCAVCCHVHIVHGFPEYGGPSTLRVQCRCGCRAGPATGYYDEDFATDAEPCHGHGLPSPCANEHSGSRHSSHRHTMGESASLGGTGRVGQ